MMFSMSFNINNLVSSLIPLFSGAATIPTMGLENLMNPDINYDYGSEDEGDEAEAAPNPIINLLPGRGKKKQKQKDDDYYIDSPDYQPESPVYHPTTVSGHPQLPDHHEEDAPQEFSSYVHYPGQNMHAPVPNHITVEHNWDQYPQYHVFKMYQPE